MSWTDEEVAELLFSIEFEGAANVDGLPAFIERYLKKSRFDKNRAQRLLTAVKGKWSFEEKTNLTASQAMKSFSRKTLHSDWHGEIHRLRQLAQDDKLRASIKKSKRSSLEHLEDLHRIGMVEDTIREIVLERLFSTSVEKVAKVKKVA